MTVDTTQSVMKTLVIGLGSTGTRICNAVAERMRWELSDLSHAPWVKFLCVETNANEESLFHQTGDFLSLHISAADYQGMLEYPQAFDEKIWLSKWIDPDTLRKLPNKDVSSGAGNIRMVGRLAFLYEENYNQLKSVIHQQLNELRSLSTADAAELHGPLSDGTQPTIAFADDGRVRIIVAGTLCGGTGSGLGADFGYFLKSICKAEERVIALLTLPRPDLATAIDPGANKYKRNAYHAVMELNHYHLAGKQEENPIRFPDGVIPDTDTFPYDLTFLAMPRMVGQEGESGLNRALADRIFLNIFVPQTDPFADAINAPITDREHRAHVFCSLGLSSIEFPAYQVIEACSKRLLAHTLREWQNRALAPAEEQAMLESLGLTWAGLRGFLCTLPGGENLQGATRKKLDEVVALARTNITAAEESLEQLRAAFVSRTGQEGGGLSPGTVPTTFATNRARTAEMVLERVRGLIATRLLEYQEGPAPLQQLLRKAQERLVELSRAQAGGEGTQAETVNALLKKLRAYHTSPLLGFFWLKRRAISRVLPHLREALEDETRERFNAEVARAFQNTPVRGGMDSGVLDRTARLLKPVQKRLDNLRTLVTALAARLHQRADELARTEPSINGLSIFEPETTTGGTVRKENERCLREAGNDPTESWEQTRELVAAQIVRAWDTLPEALLPAQSRNLGDDWLLNEVNPNSQRDQMPSSDLERLERAAREPFLRLAQVDVLARWENLPNNRQQVQNVAEQAHPFLDINKALAERGGRQPIQMRSIVLAPQSPVQDEFLRVAQQSMRQSLHTTRAISPNPFRAILLEEWYRFPLSGVPSILGKDGIHTAQCTDFPTFHTRMDVQWTGLSDGEIAALRQAEELVACGVLLSVLQPQGGALVLPWKAGGFGDADIRRFPLSLRGAAQMLAKEERDLNGRPLTGVVRLLQQRIAAIRGDSGTGNVQEIAFIHRLQDELREGRGTEIPGWHSEMVAQYLNRYCANQDADLYSAFQTVFPPDRSIIEGFHRRAGDPKPNGGIFDEDGLYCPECGGLLGKNEQDASRNGWRCFIDPTHYYGQRVQTTAGGV